MVPQLQPRPLPVPLPEIDSALYACAHYTLIAYKTSSSFLQLAAPSLVEPTSRSSHSLTLLIDIPPEYNGDYRIQWYEAGYVYSSGWQSKVVAPHSAESVPTRSGWDSDGKPVFTGQAIYTLGDLAPNKVGNNIIGSFAHALTHDFQCAVLRRENWHSP